METVVQTNTDTVLVTSYSTNTVNTSSNDIVVGLVDTSSIVSTSNESSIIIDVPEVSVVLAGQIGPTGPSAEELDVYAKRVDFISDNELYKGEAAVGSLESSPVWRIRKIILAVDGDVIETWASGTANFDKIWANRLSLSYL